jgi:hypothetical protein
MVYESPSATYRSTAAAADAIRLPGAAVGAGSAGYVGVPTVLVAGAGRLAAAHPPSERLQTDASTKRTLTAR